MRGERRISGAHHRSHRVALGLGRRGVDEEDPRSAFEVEGVFHLELKVGEHLEGAGLDGLGESCFDSASELGPQRVIAP